MKRLLKSVLLVCIVVCAVMSLASCLESGKINKAIRATNELTDIDAQIYTNVDMYEDIYRGADETRVKWSFLKNEQTETAIKRDGEKIKITSGGYKNADTTVYIDGDSVSIIENGKQTTLSKEEYNKKNGSYDKTLAMLLKALPSYAFKDADVSETNGKLTMEKKLSWDELRGIYEDFLVNLETEWDLVGEEDHKIAYNDGGTLSLTVKDGYLSELKLSFKIEFEKNEQKYSATVTTAIRISSPGQDVELDK